MFETGAEAEQIDTTTERMTVLIPSELVVRSILVQQARIYMIREENPKLRVIVSVPTFKKPKLIESLEREGVEAFSFDIVNCSENNKDKIIEAINSFLRLIIVSKDEQEILELSSSLYHAIVSKTRTSINLKESENTRVCLFCIPYDSHFIERTDGVGVHSRQRRLWEDRGMKLKGALY